MAICSKCKKEKISDDFYETSTANWCKLCYKEWHIQRYKAEAEIETKKCKNCSDFFTMKIRKKTDFCSRTCKDSHRKKQDKLQRMQLKQERNCAHCSNLITKERRADAIFCSSDCNSKAHQLQRKLRNRANEEGKRGYLRTEICQRDGWICQICKEPVEKTAHHPNPLAPSLDHIIPVSKGGSSDPSNLQLTHLRCNLKRGNKAL